MGNSVVKRLNILKGRLGLVARGSFEVFIKSPMSGAIRFQGLFAELTSEVLADKRMAIE